MHNFHDLSALEIICESDPVKREALEQEYPRCRILDSVDQVLAFRTVNAGTNSTILCRITVGKYAFVGAGAMVTKNVPDDALIVGNPDRIVGWMCRCGVKLVWKGARATCPACGGRYRK